MDKLNKFIDNNVRLISGLLIVALISLGAGIYHQMSYKDHVSYAGAIKPTTAVQKTQSADNTSDNSSQDIDCSNHKPVSPNALPVYGSSPDYACDLKCSVEQLGLLGLQAKGVTITQQIYDEVYVKNILKDNCGTPLPYCTFNSSASCPTPTTSEDSGYDAGYNYAQEYQICDPNYDNGNSQDFNDGVHSWTNANCY